MVNQNYYIIINDNSDELNIRVNDTRLEIVKIFNYQGFDITDAPTRNSVNDSSDNYRTSKNKSDIKCHESQAPINITKTCLHNINPLKTHFYIVKLGFIGVYIIFLISAQKHRLWVLVRIASQRRF